MSRELNWLELLHYLRDHRYLVDSYFVLDIETSGLRPAHDHILQVGLLRCQDDQVRICGAVYLRTAEEILQAYENGEYVRRKQAEGNSGYVKAADVRRFGVDLDRVVSLLVKVISCGELVIGHNLTRFDIPFVEGFLGRCGHSLSFRRDRILDTGALVKANKLRMLPQSGEPLWEFFGRVADTVAKGVYWRLDLAVREYGVDLAGWDGTQAHDAGTDCQMTHRLYQKIKQTCRRA